MSYIIFFVIIALLVLFCLIVSFVNKKKLNNQLKSIDDNMNDNYDQNRVYCHYRQLLLPKEKIVYDKILDGIKHQKQRISFFGHAFNFDIKEFMKIVEAIEHDHPELFYFNLKMLHLSKSYSWNILFGFEYYADIEKKQLQVQKISSKIAQAVKDLPDLEKIKIICDYVKTHTMYDDSFNIYNINENSEYPNVYGCLVNHKTTCAGISATVKYLFDVCGLKSYIIIGSDISGSERSFQIMSHGWNKVFVDGQWKHIDVTYDLNRKEPAYFLLDDEQLKKERLWQEDGINHFLGEDFVKKQLRIKTK